MYWRLDRCNRLRGVVQPTAQANLATVEIERGLNQAAIAPLGQVLPQALAL